MHLYWTSIILLLFVYQREGLSTPRADCGEVGWVGPCGDCSKELEGCCLMADGCGMWSCIHVGGGAAGAVPRAARPPMCTCWKKQAVAPCSQPRTGGVPLVTVKGQARNRAKVWLEKPQPFSLLCGLGKLWDRQVWSQWARPWFIVYKWTNAWFCSPKGNLTWRSLELSRLVTCSWRVTE